jgi:predicted murein hydrolase (TIGR00659 family)
VRAFGEWTRSPAFNIALTVAAYWLGLVLHRRWKWVPPIVAACVPIVVLLLLRHESYADYNRGAGWLSWWLTPATVALAVPMYRNGLALRSSLPRLLAIVFAGSVVGMVTAGGTAWMLGAPRDVVMSALPKSVTTPIAIEVCRELGGIPQITVGMVILAGVMGAAFGTHLLRAVGVGEDRAVGGAIGTASHGIGTASLVRRSEMQATVSSWAMAAAGVITSLLGAVLKLVVR